MPSHKADTPNLKNWLHISSSVLLPDEDPTLSVLPKSIEVAVQSAEGELLERSYLYRPELAAVYPNKRIRVCSNSGLLPKVDGYLTPCWTDAACATVTTNWLVTENGGQEEYRHVVHAMLEPEKIPSDNVLIWSFSSYVWVRKDQNGNFISLIDDDVAEWAVRYIPKPQSNRRSIESFVRKWLKDKNASNDTQYDYITLPALKAADYSDYIEAYCPGMFPKIPSVPDFLLKSKP